LTSQPFNARKTKRDKEGTRPPLRGPFPVQSPTRPERSAGEHATLIDSDPHTHARPPLMGDAEAASRVGRRGAAAAAGMRVFSPEYYALCAGGGMLAAGATHLAITPLDVLKVNMQVSRFFFSLVGRVLRLQSCGAAVRRA